MIFSIPTIKLINITIEMKTKHKSLIFSISIASILLALIIVFDFFLENIKIFNFSIQVFLIFYAMGILWIKNWQVNIFFFLSCPIILFFIEQNPYIINGIQVIFEYFLVFYIFGLFYLLKMLFAKIDIRNSKNKFFINLIFIIMFTLLIFFKYFLHSLASLTWWGKDIDSAFIFNAPWLLVNLINIPILIVIIYPISLLFYQYNYDNSW